MKTLNNLKVGSTGQVKEILTTGNMRRRLQDIGLVEGTIVHSLLKSPKGDPTAFLIRGAVIALRNEDSANILIEYLSQEVIMGLTLNSVGIKAIDNDLKIQKKDKKDKIIALAGNPNVGKSTVFNQLTGLNQHTGNWPGKTVTNAWGYCTHNNNIIVDLPGTYSLMANSQEEEIARDFICFGDADCVIVVCDGTSLERNLNLVLQTIEITNNIVVCINLMDEAQKKNIKINLKKLSFLLGVPVVGTTARKNKGLNKLMEKVNEVLSNKELQPSKINYSCVIENAISMLEPTIKKRFGENINSRWLALKLLDYNESLIESINKYLKYDINNDKIIKKHINNALKYLEDNGVSQEKITDEIVTSIFNNVENIFKECVEIENLDYHNKDRKIDKIMTNKWTGIPIMIALLAVVFWITIVGANYPSAFLSKILFWFQDQLIIFFKYIHAPTWLYEMLVLGVYRVVAWVVSVMLPPMAIFFPLFTLLEDVGYLPRIAFNLDKYFKKCCACGKQALTM